VWDFWPHFSLLALLQVVLTAVFIPWVLLTKKDATAVVAWCLAVIFLPFLGCLLFWMFGYNYLHRQVKRRRRHRSAYRGGHGSRLAHGGDGLMVKPPDSTWGDLGWLAERADAFPVSPGNAVTLYHDTRQAFDALLDAVRRAQHHVHLEFYIVHGDAIGMELLDLLTEKARAGVEVRLLHDAVGCLRLRRRALRSLRAAGGRVAAYLPVNPLSSRLHVNLRNHRKITVVDGRVGFTGGMNIGDEYLGKNAYFGYWRDTFLRVEGPATADLQHIFAEDWDYTCREGLRGAAYFPEPVSAGDAVVQVAASGPDQPINCIRAIYLMAILSARQRLWIASPYCVPDASLLDALRLARYRNVDVQLLTISRPDHYLSFYAGRYYWGELLGMGVKVWLYQKGMMHSKLVLVDGHWAMAGSANLDYRSLHLNFEAGCALHSPELVAELEDAFRADVAESVRLDAKAFASRSLAARVVENACRLLAPAL
jgi:cardiolipin synthase